MSESDSENIEVTLPGVALASVMAAKYKTKLKNRKTLYESDSETEKNDVGPVTRFLSFLIQYVFKFGYDNIQITMFAWIFNIVTIPSAFMFTSWVYFTFGQNKSIQGPLFAIIISILTTMIFGYLKISYESNTLKDNRGLKNFIITSVLLICYPVNLFCFFGFVSFASYVLAELVTKTGQQMDNWFA